MVKRKHQRNENHNELDSQKLVISKLTLIYEKLKLGKGVIPIKQQEFRFA